MLAYLEDYPVWWLRQSPEEGLIYVVYKNVDGEVCQLEW